MRPFPLVLLCLTALLVPSATADELPYDALIEFHGPTPSYTGPAGLATLQSSQPGEAYEWALNLEETYTIIQIRVTGGFNLERPMQLVPEVDDSPQHPDADHLHPHFFQRLYVSDVADVDTPARVFNLTGEASDFTYRLGFPGPGNATLSLRRDVSPPSFTVGQPTRITHIGFQLTSTTDEFAFGDARIQRPDGEVVPFPTPTPSLEQTYPIQGLAADTEYNVTVVFRDWAENEATSDSFTVRTAPAPERPIPLIDRLAPTPDAVVQGPNVEIGATVSSPESVVLEEGLRLFIDKQEVFDGLTVANGRLSILVGPMEPGLHSVSVEATNVAGGTGRAAWTFTVAEDKGAPLPGVVLVLAAVAVGLAVKGRK